MPKKKTLRNVAIRVLLVIAAPWLVASEAWAQTAVQRTFVNPGFEAPVLPSDNCWSIRAEVDVAGWSTTEPAPGTWGPSTYGDCGGHPATAPDGGIQMFKGNGGASNRLPNAGNQYAELNAFSPRRLYQEVCLLQGEQIDWSLAHAARLSANEAASFNIGTDPSGTGSQQIVRMRAGNTVAQGPVACSLGTCSLDSIDANGWREYSGSFNWNQPTGLQTIGFQAVSGGSTGNILDDIRIGLRPFVEFAQDSYDQNENAPTNNQPRLLVAGRVPAGGMTVPVNVSGGTATLGVDYTTASGTADVSVFIPAGDYDGASFPLPITIVNDGPGDPGETITFTTPDTAGIGAPYNRASLQSCGGLPRANTTSTITEVPDPLPRVQLSKALSANRLAVSDQFVLRIDGPNGQQTTTTGAGSTVASGSVTVGPARIGDTYTLLEVMAGGSPSPLSAYSPSISCTNTNSGSATPLPSGSGSSFTLVLAATDNVSCVITNEVVSQPAFIQVIKTVTSGQVYAAVGDIATYSYVVTNTGPTVVDTLTVTDDHIATVSCPVSTLGPGASTTCTGSYAVTQADIDNTLVTNIATASARNPGGEVAIDTDDAVIHRAFPSISADKSTTTASYSAVGQVIPYTYVVTNTGNVTINSLQVADDRIATVNCPVTTLAPAASTTCTASYAITQADVDAGAVTNVAVVTGTPTVGTLDPVQDTVTVNGSAAPALTLAKSVVSGAPYSAVGGVINYQYVVRNTGNVTINALSVSDDKIATVDCPVTALAPAASTTCTATHVVTQADLAAGTLTNNATASGTPTQGALTPAADSATVTGVDVRLSKTVAVRQARIGDLVLYTLRVEVIGGGSLSNGNIVDRPPAGFTYVEGSLQVADGDNAATVEGHNPLRFGGIDVAGGQMATLAYLMRVGAGVRPGAHENQARVFSSASDVPISNIATAQVELVADPLLDDSLVFGTVFHDRDGDGWQDRADLSQVRVQGGFAPEAYIPDSTTVGRGAGQRAEPDASAPLLRGIRLGAITARQSPADPAEAHQVVVRQRLRELAFTDDFVLTSAQGVAVRMDAAGATTVEKTGLAAQGLSAATPTVERRVARGENGYVVDYVIRNAGIDERGLPGVRIASVEGLLIETDEFGRYHLVGVAGGPWERGRNFILKVDPSTLPPDASFTTDNPVLRRLTPGVPVRFDWGVTLPEQRIEGGSIRVELELGEVFFAPGSAEVRAQHRPAIEAMAVQVRRHRGGEVVIDATGDYEGLAFERALAVKNALLEQLDEVLAKGLVISARANVDDPDSLVVGVDEGGALLGTVLFDTNQAAIRPEFEPLLDKVAAALEKMGGGSIAIVGHTDIRASHAYNVSLGMRRAEAVFEALAKRLSPQVRAKVRVQASNDPTAPVGEKKN